ncbi:hypothetical protein ACFE04_017244 [Oxalis oulophora]
MKLFIVVLFLSTTTFVVGIENKDATLNQSSPIENKIISLNQSSPIENKNASFNQSSPANKIIPHEPSKLDEWIKRNMNEFKHREPTLARGFKRSILDHALVNAEQGGIKLIRNITVESAKISGKGVITTHARKNVTVDSGFVFAHSGLIGSANTDTYISHAWREQPRVVFAHSFMGTVIRDKVRSHGNLTEHNRYKY